MEWRELIPAVRSRRFWSVSSTTVGAAVVLVTALYGLGCAAKGMAEWLKDKKAPFAEHASSVSSWYDSLSWQAWALAGLSALVVCNALVAGYRVWRAEERAQKEIEAVRGAIPEEVSRRIKEAFDNMTFTTSTAPFIPSPASEGRIAELTAEVEQLRKRRADKERLDLARKLCVGAGSELEAALADSSVFPRIASWSYRFPRFITEVFAVSSNEPAAILGTFAKAGHGDTRRMQMALVRIPHDMASRLNEESLAADFDPVDGNWDSWAPAKAFPYRASGGLRESVDAFAVTVQDAALANAQNAIIGEARLDAVRRGCDLLLEQCNTLRARVRTNGSSNMQSANEFGEAVASMLVAFLTPNALRAEHAAFDLASDLAFAASPPQPLAALDACRAWLVKFRERVTEPMLRERLLALVEQGQVAADRSDI